MTFEILDSQFDALGEAANQTAGADLPLAIRGVRVCERAHR
jgi:hypothetical protein